MALYYNGHKVKNLYYNGKCITRLALGKEMTRLVEGDDFVRAQWLKGDGNAAIQTTELFASTDSIETHIDITGFPAQKWSYIYGNDSADHDYTLMAVLFPNRRLQFRPQREEIDTSIRDYTIIHDLNGVYVNGVKVINTQKEFVASTNPISVFTSNNFDSQSIKFSGRISYFNIPNKLALTPCRLLRPIPSTLDGNGRVRNAGECGMYDSISGKFYGNVATTGNFTVSDN